MSYQNVQRTLAIIKPDAVSKKHSGKIISMIERADLSIIGMKLLHLTSEQAAAFYAVHTGKSFFEELIAFMSSGKIIVLALEGNDAINLWRKVMGATDPAKAEDGTIRKLFGTAVNRNACHGSDAPETAETELNFFFTPEELVS
jgi:nucleoside-diphosphate kinase